MKCFRDATLLALLYESGPSLDSVLEIRSSQDHFQTEVAKTTSKISYILALSF